MSSIYIHGVSMPTSCAKCPCSDDMGKFCHPANEYIPMLGRPEWCPLIEVPPHGRLGDLDALAAKDTAEYEEAINFAIDLSARTLFDCTHREVQKAIKNAPTVIPADPEGGEANG